MDDGRGHLKELAPEVVDQIKSSGADMDKVPIFKVMETVEIRGARFQIMKITGNQMVIRVLPRGNEQN